MKELKRLSIEYLATIRLASDLSKLILQELRIIYTDETLITFKSFDDFLCDINYNCEDGGLGKLLFIKEIKDRNLY